MAIKFLKQVLPKVQGITEPASVPRGHFAVYIGECEKRRFVILISYLNHPSIQTLLERAEEEFGFAHPDMWSHDPMQRRAFIDLLCGLH